MKALIEKKNLLLAIRQASSVVERRGSIAILSNVKITFAGEKATFEATDLDIEIGKIIPATVSSEGSITAPAQTLSDIVSKLPDGEISLELKDQNLIVKSCRSCFKLACLPVTDFPNISSDTYEHNFTLTAKELIQIIDNSSFAASIEETRYYLNGVYLHVDGANLIGVATDGHRFASSEVAAPEGASGFEGVILPSKAIGIVRKSAETEGAEIKIGVSSNKINFSFDSCSITSKLIDGTFPDYKRVIPTGNDKLAVVNTDELKAAIDRVATISDFKTRAIKFEFSNGQIEISTNSGNGSSASEIVEYEGEFDLVIGFNSKYILDALTHVDSDTCELSLKARNLPCIVRGTNIENTMFIVMPLAVN